MTAITLNVPDNEIDFFMTLIRKFNCQSISTDFKITDEMKTLLDERRLSSNIDDFIPCNEAKNQLQFKS